MFRRLATEADRAALSAFSCVRTGTDYEFVPQEWIQRVALDWSFHEDNWLWLTIDDEGEFLDPGSIAAVIGHGDDGRAGLGRFIPALGVDPDVHGNEVGGDALYAVYVEASGMVPGGELSWKVHPRNLPCQRMCAKLGWTDWTTPYEEKPYLIYTVDLPVPTAKG
jgi:RimJ/RimL family protein N-acetyltransferase